MVHKHLLTGCTPTPLGHYLKALGTLRLVAEQKDSKACGYWRDDTFVLQTHLDWEALERFFLEEYRPTPILAPWNGGSGFYPKDNKEGINRLLTASLQRFGTFSAAIQVAQKVLQDCGLTTERPKDLAKRNLIERLRAEWPDEALPWLDAALTLTDKKTGFPPLFGSGGNDGRLEFTNNFHQRLLMLFDLNSGAALTDGSFFLAHSLLGLGTSLLVDGAVGQYLPGAIGGVNASTGFSGDTLGNPWDFLLMLEGSLLFASVITRKLGSSEGSEVGFPFTVKAMCVGSGQSGFADQESARAELWLPLWDAPATFAELRVLFGEGRATLGRRPARDGLDFVRSVAGLGVDRGLTSFQRFGILNRNGMNYLATPLSRVAVRRNLRVDLIRDLDQGGWLSRVGQLAANKKEAHRLTSLAGRVMEGLFEFSKTPDNPIFVQEVLMALGRLHVHLALASGSREKLPPVPLLSPDWLFAADDASDELRLATALAGLYWPKCSMRNHVLPMAENGRGWAAAKGESRDWVWTKGGVVANLLAVLQRRLWHAQYSGQGDIFPDHGLLRVDRAALAAFLAGACDDDRLGDLLAGLILLKWQDMGNHVFSKRSAATSGTIPASFAALKLLTLSPETLHYFNVLPVEGVLSFPREIPAVLAAGQRQRAVTLAWQRLRSSGIKLMAHTPDVGLVAGERMGAALLLPMDAATLGGMIRQLHIGEADLLTVV
ncbi:MAG: type I-U CRISPR-associated protein Csx17 [Magnetococcus sp. DMHC-6]